jgi:catechol 2,3-dioxygenase-like lactoylglutathione lyase family enzyme
MSEPQVAGLLEGSLYVADLKRSSAFYRGLFGFTPLFADERMAALEVPGRQVLLLFRQGGTAETISGPSGTIPAHDATGRIHCAFSIALDDLEAWRGRLASAGISIEAETRWPRGGTSLYFRDPDGHLLELATPGLWWPI